MNTPIKKILFIRTDLLGDLVLSLPAIYALKKTYPETEIYLAVSKENEGLVKHLTYLSGVFTLNKKSILSVITCLLKIRNGHFDAAFHILPGSSCLGSFLTAFSNAKLKIGYKNYFGRLYTNKITDTALDYEPINVLKIIQNVFPDLKISDSGIQEDPHSSANNTALLKNYGIKDGENYIVLHACASKTNPKKIWPEYKFHNLIKLINKEFDIKIILIGTASEEKIINDIILGTKNTISLAGKLNLCELASIIKKCTLFIGNNSGPLQLAVAFDSASVSIIGLTMKRRWVVNNQKHIVIQKDLDCVPCEGTKIKCKDNICMKNISEEEVFQQVKLQLNNAGIKNEKN